jgi:hypothetical protein
MDSVPDAVPLVAVIVALPEATAVTRPELETLAIAGALLVQVIGAVTTLPLASSMVAV